MFDATGTAVGFEATRCELVEKDITHGDANGLAGWLRTTWFPWTQQLPEADREEFLADVVARYLSHHPPDADRRTHVRMVRLEVEALRR